MRSLRRSSGRVKLPCHLPDPRHPPTPPMTVIRFRVACCLPLIGVRLPPPIVLAIAEDRRREVDIGKLEPLHEAGTYARWPEPPKDTSIFYAGLLENEQVLHRNDVTLHPQHFADVGDFAAAIFHALLMNDEMNGAGDLLADGS